MHHEPRVVVFTHIYIYIYICDFLLRQSYIMPLYSHHISFYPQELNKLVKHHDMPKKYPHLARIFRWCFPILFHDIPFISPIVFPQKKCLIPHGNVHLCPYWTSRKIPGDFPWQFHLPYVDGLYHPCVASHWEWWDPIAVLTYFRWFPTCNKLETARLGDFAAMGLPQ